MTTATQNPAWVAELTAEYDASRKPRTASFPVRDRSAHQRVTRGADAGRVAKLAVSAGLLTFAACAVAFVLVLL